MTTNAITTTNADRQLTVGAAADQFARAGVFEDYQRRRAANTLSRQRDDLRTFAAYLAQVHFYEDASGQADRLYSDPLAWAGITYGLVAGFVQWMLKNGYAVGTVNLKLSTVKQYAKLAFQAKALDTDQHSLIRTISGYKYGEQSEVNAKRSAEGAATRKGTKKEDSIVLTAAQVKALQTQPNTPQGRRDALIMALLLDLGLRVGELAILNVSDFNLEADTVTFYRPKVKKNQTDELNTVALKKAVHAWFDSGDAPAVGRVLRTSAKSKDGDKLGGAGMSLRALKQRVNILGERAGITGLSAHDLRHTGATRFARLYKDQPFALQDWGGWNSLAMPRRYVEAEKIANKGYGLNDVED